MATPALENLVKTYPKAQITVLGSPVSTAAISRHPNVVNVIVMDKKYSALRKTAKELGRFDLFVSLRFSARTKYLKLFVDAGKKIQLSEKKYRDGNRHMVNVYNDFLNDALGTNHESGKLVLHGFGQEKSGKAKVGINPGAAYGSAKRWYPEEFAKVAIELSEQYDIVIFGGPAEVSTGQEIENFLIDAGVKNYQNLSGKTTIPQLIEEISTLDLFVTGDSGPMHLAAAFQVPTVAVFGPTRDKETHQWKNPKSTIVKQNLDCQPCMERTCPLGHHNCMKLTKAKDVLNAVKAFNL